MQLERTADVPIDRIPELMDWLISFLGEDWVRTKVQTYERRTRQRFRTISDPSTHPLVPGLAYYRRLKGVDSVGESAWLTQATLRAGSHAFDLRFVGNYIPGVLQSRSLLGRLRSTRNAASLLFELSVAVHYLLQNCGVQLPELTGNSRIDVLVEFGRHEIEIQCKRKALGSGRKIPNPLFDRLVEGIARSWAEAPGAFAIQLQCDDRLKAEHVPQLAARIAAALDGGWQGDMELIGGSYALSVRRVAPVERMMAAIDVLAMIGRFFDDPDRPAHVALLDWVPMELAAPDTRVNPAHFVCQSQKPDQVLDNVMDSFREGAGQLSGTRPGIVTVHIPEHITQDTLERMKTSTAVAHALHEEFAQPGRSLHKAAAAILSAENVSPFDRGVWSGDFPGVLFRNHIAKHSLPDRYPILGARPASRSETR